MSSDGGSNYDPISEIKKAADTLGRTLANPGSLIDPNNPLNLMNIGTNAMTMGVVGYDGRGFNTQAGVNLGAADEFVGGISGRNRAREELYQAGQRLQLEDAKRAQLLADERARQAQMDRSASESAAAGRISSRMATSRGGVPTIMGDVTQGDLLGL